jgi:hypothetical protein
VAEVTVEGIHNRGRRVAQLSRADGSILEIDSGETVRGPFVITYDDAENDVIRSPNEIWIISDAEEYRWATVRTWTPGKED